MSESSDKPIKVMPLWPFAVSLLLAIAILMLLARPCELYRVKVSVIEPAFGWSNTVCADWPDRGCYCQTVDYNDPMLIAPGLEPRPKSKDRGMIVPEVQF